MADDQLIVQMRGITKRFPGVLANDSVDLDVRAGEVHALLGENGAGKSTLMNVLTGLYHPDAGEIIIRGKPTELRSPRNAIEQGIGMVHQHFKLVNVQTVTENIIIGMPEPKFYLNLRKIEAEIAGLAEQYGMPVDPKAFIWQLSVGEQQRVEILKMLYRGAEVLILDEPTAVLTPQEVERMFETVRKLKDAGKAIIFITHKMNEVQAVADRITVLRDGRVARTTTPQLTDSKELATLMVGRDVLFRLDKGEPCLGEVVLKVEKVSAQNDRGLPALREMSFCISQGEILGVAGVAGNGQRELAEVLTGLRRATGGSITVGGKNITNSSSRRVIEHKVGHIPEDRLGEGLVPSLPVSDNEILKDYRSKALTRGPFLIQKRITDLAHKLISAFNIDTPGPHTPVRMLSGGNQQKVLLARELHLAPDLLVAVHPTRGLDIGATEFVRKRILQQRQEGTAVLLISEDLEEVLAVSDRVAVIYEGQIMGIVPVDEADIGVIGLMMAGSHGDQAMVQEGAAE